MVGGVAVLLVTPAQPLAKRTSRAALPQNPKMSRRRGVRTTTKMEAKTANMTRNRTPLLMEGVPKPGMSVDRAVVMETVAVIGALPVRATEDGSTAQVASAGAPVQPRVTLWLKPPSGLTATLRLADWPAFTVLDEGETEREKSIPVPDRLTV